MIYTLPANPDLAAVPPDLHQLLVMLLVDGVRDPDGIVAASPLSPDLTREVLLELRVAGLVKLAGEATEPPPGAAAAEPKAADPPAGGGTASVPGGGAWVNPRARKRKAEDEDRPAAAYTRWPILQRDLKHPPADFLAAVPRLTGKVDPAEITGDAAEYYLLSRVDGATTVEGLQSLTAMAMPTVVRRLVKHACAGALTFPAEVADRWFTAPAEAVPGRLTNGNGAGAASQIGGATGPTLPETYRLIEARMVDDPAISGPLRRTLARLPPGGPPATDLTQKECLVLSLIQGETGLGDLAANGPGDSRDLLMGTLDLYRRRCLALRPPERAPRPAPERAQPAKAGAAAPLRFPPAAEADETDEGTLELDFSTGEFSVDAFLDSLAGEAHDDPDAPVEDAGPAGAAPRSDATATMPPAVGRAVTTPFDEAEIQRRADSTSEMFTLPAALFRGVDLDGYDAAWTQIPHKGDLARVPFQAVFGFIVARGLTGILHVRRGKDQRNVWFGDGAPVHATSTEAEDLLGSVLWKTGRIDKDTYLRLERLCRDAPDREPWEILQEMYVLVPDEVLEGRRLQLVHIAARLHHAKSGQYLWVGKERLQSDLEMLHVGADDIRSMVDELAPRSVTSKPEGRPVTPPAGIEVSVLPPPAPASPTPPQAERPPSPSPPPPVAERVTTPYLGVPEPRQHPNNPSGWISEHMDDYCVVPREATNKLRDLRLGEKERRYIDALCENRHRLRELLAMSSLGRTRTHQFLAALWSKGLFDFVDEIDKEDEALRTLETLNKCLVRMETGDLFHALGCHVSATPRELAHAYSREKARFDPAKFAEREQAFRDVIDRVNLVMERAYSRLANTASRREYRLETFGQTRLTGFAEVQAKKADVFCFLKQDYVSARHLYGSAWDLIPDSLVYLSHMGYCHFRAYHTDAAERERGVQMVERAVSQDSSEPRILLVAALLERDRKDGGKYGDYIARVRKLVHNEDEFQKLLRAYRLNE